MKQFIEEIITATAFFCIFIFTANAAQPKYGIPADFSISYLDSTVSLTWSNAGAKQYYIYSQVDPYGEYTLIDSTTSLTWSGNYTHPRNFFYVTSQLDFVWVQGGTFQMGDRFSEGESNELPLHNVTLSDFYIGESEVTQSEWTQYMPASTYNWGSGTDYPVYYVNWYEILKYCNLRSIAEGLTPCYSIGGSTNPANWGSVPVNTQNYAWEGAVCNWNANGYRLPTEAEWEYAARGGIHNSDNYHYSGSDVLNDVSWNYYNSGNLSHQVKTRAANQLGIFDMSGNVWEWVWDRNAAYTSGDQTNPTGSGDIYTYYHIWRGGRWQDYPNSHRVAKRNNDVTWLKVNYIGFRLARKP